MMMSRLKREIFENIVYDILLDCGELNSRNISIRLNKYNKSFSLTAMEVAKRLQGMDFVKPYGKWHERKWVLVGSRKDVIKHMLKNELKLNGGINARCL